MFKSLLAGRLLLYIVAFSTLITFLITAIQFYFDYKNEIIAYELINQQISDVHLKTLTNRLWVADVTGLRDHLLGIFKIHGVLFLQVKKEEKVWASFGDDRDENTLIFFHELTRQFQGQKLNIGTLTVKMDLTQRYLHKVWKKRQAVSSLPGEQPRAEMPLTEGDHRHEEADHRGGYWVKGCF